MVQPWGVQMIRVEINNIELPQEMKRSMAVEAEAAREANAKIAAARGERESAKILAEAAQTMDKSPSTMLLRAFQTLQAVANEGKSNTILFPMPIDMANMAKVLPMTAFQQ